MHGAPPPTAHTDANSPGVGQDHRHEVVFYLNGVRQTVTGDTVHLTLADWLRRQRGLVGTKVMCNEGDCGACSVLVGRPQVGDNQRLRYQTIDSCIAFLFQLDRSHVVTVEGLTPPGCGSAHRQHTGSIDLSQRRASSATPELTPIQRAMVDCHASQCGYCTPGFVVTLHGMMESDEAWTDQSMRDGLSGNLCRCTGYLQILQAGRRVAEQLRDRPDDARRLFQSYDEAAILNDFRSLGDGPVECNDRLRAFIPRTVEQACAYRATHSDAKVVAGATDFGVLRNHQRLSECDVIYVGQVDDGQATSASPNGAKPVVGFQDVLIGADQISIGAGATWTLVERAIAAVVPEYHQILTRFGSPQIRNAGTVGGNLANGSPIADSVPFHLVLDTELELASVKGRRRIRIEDFYLGYRKTALAANELIVSIHTRLPRSDEKLRLFKISKRRDMDISTVTCGILAKIVNNQIEDIKVAVGGVGPQVLRVTVAEAYLRGKPWGPQALREAGRLVRQQVTPWTDVRGSAEYRAQLVENLMTRAYYIPDGHPTPRTEQRDDR